MRYLCSAQPDKMSSLFLWKNLRSPYYQSQALPVFAHFRHLGPKTMHPPWMLDCGAPSADSNENEPIQTTESTGFVRRREQGQSAASRRSEDLRTRDQSGRRRAGNLSRTMDRRSAAPGGPRRRLRNRRGDPLTTHMANIRLEILTHSRQRFAFLDLGLRLLPAHQPLGVRSGSCQGPPCFRPGASS